MKCEVLDHLLFVDGQQVEYRESPNVGREITPSLIMIHYTGDNSMKGAVSWLCYANPDPSKRVSAHLVIGKDGSIIQLVPFNRVALHAGRSQYDGRTNVNAFSVGIENVGIGDEWPDAQKEAIREVIRALFAAYPMTDVVGHSDVAPGRKPDPGPNFPWNEVTS
jgi:N-acetylmuramoyl-L-alanine amidase